MMLKGKFRPDEFHYLNFVSIAIYWSNAYIMYYLTPVSPTSVQRQGRLSRYLPYAVGILSILLWIPAQFYLRHGNPDGWAFIAPSGMALPPMISSGGFG